MRLTLLLFLIASTSGAQWTIQPTNTTSDLRGIHAVSPSIAWASGSHGTILHTTDGGDHWLQCPVPPDADKLDFRGIQAFDAQTAIIMASGKGDLSRLYKTTNACKTWTLILINPDKDGFWDSIRATSSEDHKSIDATIAGDPVQGSFTLFNLNISLSTQMSLTPLHYQVTSASSSHLGNFLFQLIHAYEHSSLDRRDPRLQAWKVVPLKRNETDSPV